MAQVQQESFEAGEIGRDHLWRADLKVRARSAESLANCRLRISGALDARPGTLWRDNLDGDGWVHALTLGQSVFILVLTAETLEVWNKATRTKVQTVTGCGWTAAFLPDIEVATGPTQAFVYHPQMPTQVIERSTAGVWSVSAFTFDGGIGNSIRQPYYRFADKGVTVTPSALSGTGVTLTASAASFVAGHVGKRFRLQGREVEVTGFTSATVVTVTVRQTLHPTVTLPVQSSVGFEVGEIVRGEDSQAEGEVTAVGSGTLTILMQKFTDFFWDSSLSRGERIIGRNASTVNTAAATTTSAAAVLDWDEQAISDVRGYPGTGAVHKGRHWLTRLPLIPDAVLASALGAFDDFEVGTNDADAIFEQLADEDAGTVQHIVSAEQLLVMTRRGLFYYPESEQNPIRPTGFQLIQVGPDGSSLCRPVRISEGVLFCETSGDGVLGAFPTGDVRRSWRSTDVSQLSAHLIRSPRQMAYVTTQNDGPERYAYAVNDDGSMAVVYYSEAAEMFGWVPWTTRGLFRSVAAVEGEAWVIVRRGDQFMLELFDETALMDAEIEIEPEDYVAPATVETILSPAGLLAAEEVFNNPFYDDCTASLMIGDAYVGETVVEPGGDFGTLATTRPKRLGFGFACECKPWPVVRSEDDRARRRKSRITRALPRWAGRYLAVNGVLVAPYRGGEDTALAPPLRDEITKVPCFGWADEPQVTFSRPYPAPWRFYGYALEVKS
ncbi:MAG: hypothetical protein ACK4E3_03615 [Brevundimonas sp.]|uniref:hypothetical protein n=1 Tax=Brevundimonas sp. TaxID=1871086 RepID=UPI00391C2479